MALSHHRPAQLTPNQLTSSFMQPPTPLRIERSGLPVRRRPTYRAEHPVTKHSWPDSSGTPVRPTPDGHRRWGPGSCRAGSAGRTRGGLTPSTCSMEVCRSCMWVGRDLAISQEIFLSDRHRLRLNCEPKARSLSAGLLRGSAENRRDTPCDTAGNWLESSNSDFTPASARGQQLSSHSKYLGRRP